jgi:hypothetical protein
MRTALPDNLRQIQRVYQWSTVAGGDPMKKLKTLIHIFEDGTLLACDTIVHDKKLWLVPEWLTGPQPNTERPARLIGLHGLQINTRTSTGASVADQELLIPLSKDTLAGGTAQGLVVIEAPDIILNVDK